VTPLPAQVLLDAGADVNAAVAATPDYLKTVTEVRTLFAQRTVYWYAYLALVPGTEIAAVGATNAVII
jgi:hypothetical protein